jgi:SAM-dependent methyltransferase
MRRPERTVYDAALRRARLAAYPPGEFVGQESFMTRTEILAMAREASVGPGVSVLDLCCGVAGPGRLVTAELGCAYRGVDRSASAIQVARARATGLDCRFEVAEVPPVPDTVVDVVLLLETMLAFEDKEPLLRGIADALAPGGRFAFTVEEGLPLTDAEEQAMPCADTVWPVRLPDLLARLGDVGLDLRWVRDLTRSHRRVADGLVTALEAERSAIAADLGHAAVDDLLAAHRLWSSWMGSGRIHKLAVVTEKIAER